MNIQCRLFGMPETTRTLSEPVTLDHAPDVYCKQFCRCNEGEVHFVQVWTGDSPEPKDAELWRCEVAMKEGGVLALFSVQATEEEMQRELAQEQNETEEQAPPTLQRS